MTRAQIEQASCCNVTNFYHRGQVRTTAMGILYPLIELIYIQANFWAGGAKCHRDGQGPVPGSNRLPAANLHAKSV
jgi:hypothetical protein